MTEPPAESAPQLHANALRLARAGQLGQAQAAVLALTRHHPRYVPGWRLASEIALRTADARAALALIDQGLALAPRDAPMRLQRAACLLRLGRRREVLDLAHELRRDAEHDPALLDNLGALYSHCGDQPRALEAYERALALAPDPAPTLFNRATVRRFMGDFVGAEADYDAVIRARPQDYEAIHNRSGLRRQTLERNHIAELEALLRPGIKSPQGEVQVRYALAKEYEDIGEHEKSWAQLERGARLRRAHLDYDVERDVRTVDWICRAFPGTVGPSGAPEPGSPEGSSPEEGSPDGGVPIFIVGLPRSGSSLIERILGSHREVTAAGELDDFAQALTAAVRARSGRWPLAREAFIEAAAEVDFAALGADYLARARPPELETRYFTDKMPLNYLYCGLIARALPAARIIHVTREPLAVCYAMYKTLFKQGYPFSYDLSEIGRYYLGYRRLMQHWEATLPGSIHTVSYEALIAEQRGATRRLLDICGLPWQEECLGFEHNRTPVMTASAVQVRQSLYRSSLAQWRHYERELETLAAQLREGGVTLEGAE